MLPGLSHTFKKYTEKMFSFASRNMIGKIGIYKLSLTNGTDPLRSPGLRVFNTFLSFWFPSRLSLIEWHNGICCNLCWQWQTTLMNWLPLWTASTICRHNAVTERHSFTNLLPCKVVSVLNACMQLHNILKFPVEFWIWLTTQSHQNCNCWLLSSLISREKHR